MFWALAPWWPSQESDLTEIWSPGGKVRNMPCHTHGKFIGYGCCGIILNIGLFPAPSRKVNQQCIRKYSVLLVFTIYIHIQLTIGNAFYRISTTIQNAIKIQNLSSKRRVGIGIQSLGILYTNGTKSGMRHQLFPPK
jgi:hypothetical protein